MRVIGCILVLNLMPLFAAAATISPGDGPALSLDFSQFEGEPVGAYSLVQIETARRNPGAADLIADRRVWLSRNLNALLSNTAADPLELVRATLCASELECLTGDTSYRGARLILCRRLAAAWPMGLDRHNQFLPLLDLCRVASLTQDSRAPLRSLFERAIVEMESPQQTLFGTSIGKTQLMHYWVLRALGRYDDALQGALNGYGSPDSTNYEYWSYPRLLREAVDDNGLFNFNGTDIWYWGMTSHPTFVSIGAPLRNQLPEDLRRKFDLVYALPLRLLGHGGAHPQIGEANKNPKPYGFYSRWRWTWCSNDEASRWARKHVPFGLDTPCFDDLTLPISMDAADGLPADGSGDDRPAIARGDRMFDGRIEFIELDGRTEVHFLGDGHPLNASHRSPASTPRRQIIRNGRVEFVRE